MSSAIDGTAIDKVLRDAVDSGGVPHVAAIAANDEAPRGSYVSLLDWKERWLDQGLFPFTPLVSDVLGLVAACDELLAVGLEESFARHELAARACRSCKATTSSAIG